MVYIVLTSLIPLNYPPVDLGECVFKLRVRDARQSLFHLLIVSLEYRGELLQIAALHLPALLVSSLADLKQGVVGGVISH